MFGQVGVLIVDESEAQLQSKPTRAHTKDFEIRFMIGASVILACRLAATMANQIGVTRWRL
jgi:hypothetical protein